MTICKKCAYCVEFTDDSTGKVMTYHACAASPRPSTDYGVNYVTGEKMVHFVSLMAAISVPYKDEYPDHKYLACATVNKDGKCAKYEGLQ